MEIRDLFQVFVIETREIMGTKVLMCVALGGNQTYRNNCVNSYKTNKAFI